VQFEDKVVSSDGTGVFMAQALLVSADEDDSPLTEKRKIMRGSMK
jgi:hypothetical protein